jgi:hypothetical protein
MSPRRAVLAALLLLATGALYLLNRNAAPDSAPADSAPARPMAGERPATGSPVPSAPKAPGAAGPAAAAAGAPFNPADFPIAAQLNAADSTIRRDLEILDQVLEAWRTNFPREGNPVGENRDITLALTGTNRINFALIPPKHPAINAAGELCDRWGTPFRFHQLSGERMEIRSAGPDRRFATPDDAVWNPSSVGTQDSP